MNTKILLITCAAAVTVAVITTFALKALGVEDTTGIAGGVAGGISGAVAGILFNKKKETP